MTTSTDSFVYEIAVFEVAKNDINKVIALSEKLFDEINAESKLITAHKILTNLDNITEVCWHLTWINAEAVQAIRLKWETLPSAKPIEELVGKKHYYGHFVEVIANEG